MSAKLQGANDQEKLKDLSTKTYKEQAVWYLNAFWDEGGKDNTEQCWSYVEKIAKIDLQKGATGNEVDEMQMHRFLEGLKETMTVREMRDTLRAKGAISDSVKLVALIHYLIYRYSVDFHVLVNAPQGDNRAEIEEAQRMLDAVQEALQEAETKAQEAKQALAHAKAQEAKAKQAEADAKAREAEAKAREADAKAREADAKSRAEEAKTRETEASAKAADAKQKADEANAAKVELETALAEVKKQEDAFNKITEDLTRKTTEGSVVSQNKAKNELAQHLASDPLPLRKAKITQEAAVKKADKTAKAAADAKSAADAAAQQATKARKEAEEAAKEAEAARKQAEAAARQAEQARAAAEEAARQAEQARIASEKATQAAEAAVADAQKKFDEAEAYLNMVKSKPGKAQGAIWWMERELHEKKKFMPTRLGGITK